MATIQNINVIVDISIQNINVIVDIFLVELFFEKNKLINFLYIFLIRIRVLIIILFKIRATVLSTICTTAIFSRWIEIRFWQW